MKTAHSKQDATDLARPYEPTPEERAVLHAASARKKGLPPAPSMKVLEQNGVPVLDLDHPDLGVANVLLMEALGTADLSFLDGMLSQLANVGARGGKIDERGLNFMLSMVRGVQPKDQTEAMLAAQMAAVHVATMTFAQRLAHVDNIAQQDSAERAFNKLARTFAVQLEALKRYRSGGEQTVRVEHVTVNKGGQAIVGSVTHAGGGDAAKMGEQPHAKQLAHAPGEAMPSPIEAEREAVPLSGGEG